MKNTKRSVRFTLAAAGILAIFGIAWRSVQSSSAKETTSTSIQSATETQNASLLLTPLTKRDERMVARGSNVKVLLGKPPTAIIDFGTADAFGDLQSTWTGAQAKYWLKTQASIHSQLQSQLFREITRLEFLLEKSDIQNTRWDHLYTATEERKSLCGLSHSLRLRLLHKAV